MNNVEINKNIHLSQHLTSSSVATLGHSSELDGSRLSPHFTLGELLEMLRSEWNKRYGSLTPDPSPKGEGSEYKEEPIIINSGYRSEAVNKAVGGAPNSNHLTGCAADIRVAGIEQLVRYATILLDISDESQEDFDELLIEQSAKSLWIHFAVRPSGNRRKVRLMKG